MLTELTQQVIDLQSRLAFQEDALHTMSEQMALQADALQLAQQQIQILNQKLNDVLSAIPSRQNPGQERPPHY